MHANHLTRAPFAGYAIEFHMILATAGPRQSIGYLYGASGGRLEVKGGLDAKVIGPHVPPLLHTTCASELLAFEALGFGYFERILR